MEIRNWDPGNRSGVRDSHRIDHYYLESFEGIWRGYEDFGRKIRSDLGKNLNRKGKLGFKGYWGLMRDLYRIGLRDQRPILFQSKDIRGMRIGSAERLIPISRWLGAVKGKGIKGRLRMIMIIGVGISIFVIIKTNFSEDGDFDQGLWWVSSNQPHIDLCCSYFSYTDKPFLEGISQRQRWFSSVAIMVWSTKDL
ncbi:BnaC06g42470D, partial [Brassica napus]